MPEYPIDADLAALSAALGGLTPNAPALNRDRLLYEAGRRAARRRPVAWPIVAGMFAVLSAGLGTRLVTAPPQVQLVYLSGASQERERPEVAIQEKTPVTDVLGSPLFTYQPRPAGATYLQLREQAMRFGADSLPTAGSSSAEPQMPVEQLLGLPFGTLDDTLKSRWEHQLFRGAV